MTDATILALVTIVCTCITTSIGLIVRSNVKSMAQTINEQTKEIAGLHQTVIAQSARIYDAEATKKGATPQIGRPANKEPTEQPYTANPPYRPPDARK